MRIHHLNCISACPLGGRLMDGRSARILQRGHLACHCVLVETATGLVLVDTGLGLRDVADPKVRLSRIFRGLLAPDLREEMTAVRQIAALGFDPRDVQHIILTHLDFDHAGGLDDFPGATVHLMQAERDYALQQLTWIDRQRFRAQQWNTRAQWKVYNPDEGDNWFGFTCVRSLDEVSPDILMVGLNGHTLGHAGIAMNVDGRWLLHAGDAYFFHAEMNIQDHWCTPGLLVYQTLMELDRSARLHNQQRLRELKSTQSHQVEIFCSHDVSEFERLAGRPAKIPAAKFPAQNALQSHQGTAE